jgi:DNA-binding NarL/FixJ family response regulator
MAAVTAVLEATMRASALTPASTQAPIPVIVVDASPVFRDGIAALLLAAGYEILGTAAGASEAIRLVDNHASIVIVASAQLPGVTGVLLAAVLRRRCPSARVVLLLGAPTGEQLLVAARAGVAAVLSRDADAATLCTVVARAARGEMPILESFVARWDVARTVLRLLYAPADARPGVADGAPTTSELLALDCLARGLSAYDASGWLCLEPDTLRNHLIRLRARHGLHSRTQLLRFAAERGWIAPFPLMWDTAA